MSGGEFTAEMLNLLVYRYFQDQGLTHAAFALHTEAQLQESHIDGGSVPTQALVTLVQKGLMYKEHEANLDSRDDEFTLLQLPDIVKKPIVELEKSIREHKDQLQKDSGFGLENISLSSLSVGCKILISDVTILEGHDSEVFGCAWSPTDPLLASGSGDSTARIWRIPDSSCGPDMKIQPENIWVLKHLEGVSALNWNENGTLLATGSNDGQARIWNKDGLLFNTLDKHKDTVNSLKWSKNGNYLLSGSNDKSCILWNTKTWKCKQRVGLHKGRVLDVDWRNNSSFATCSSDNMIYAWKIGRSQPTNTFAGHKDEVNCIRWSSDDSLLASCSDDGTVKIWHLRQSKCVHNFNEHTKVVYTLRWSPSGSGTVNAKEELKLASGSFDSTIKIWRVGERGSLFNLNCHEGAVYSVAFSPTGEYLASGSEDKSVLVWSMKDGKVVKKYCADDVPNVVCWNPEGNRIAVCYSNKTLKVLDLRS